MRAPRFRTAKILASVSAGIACLALTGPAQATQAAPAARAHVSQVVRYRVRQILNGMNLQHTYLPAGSSTPTSEPLSNPDDITVLGHHLFTAFQNGVGPQGEPSADGNTDSTIVEFTSGGRVIHQWDITGKCDGLTADPRVSALIATVNEDANSSIYVISPGAMPAAQVKHFHYAKPLPHLGGTDAISIDRGRILVSASAPGTTGAAAPQPTYPAVYQVVFRARHIASAKPLFYDEAHARVANVGRHHGQIVKLALTDPDSNEVVPRFGHRFTGDFMLTSQGDKEQIFARLGARTSSVAGLKLSVLRLSQAVDDTAWARRGGRIFGSDTDGDTIDVVTGPFRTGSIFVAVTPCDAANAPATCPGPGFPANYLGQLNPWTGHVSPVRVAGAAFEPHGMVFVGPDWQVSPG